MLRTQVTNLLNKANSFKDSYSCGKKKMFVVDFRGMVGIGSQMGLAPQTWQLKSAFAIESHSGRDGDIQSYLCPGWTIPGTSQASSCPRNLECIVWGKAGLLEGEPGGGGSWKIFEWGLPGCCCWEGGDNIAKVTMSSCCFKSMGTERSALDRVALPGTQAVSGGHASQVI